MNKKTMPLAIIVVLLAGMFAAAIPLAKCDPQGMIIGCNETNYFSHDETIVTTSTYHESGWYWGGDLQARLLRSIYWFTSADAAIWGPDQLTCGTVNMWIKTEDFGAQLGYIDQNTISNFNDVLDLSGLTYNLQYYQNAPPSQWTGVHWVVGYKIEYYYGNTLVATTGDMSPGYPHYITDSIRLGHDELSFFTTSVVDYSCYSGYGSVYNADNVIGAANGKGTDGGAALYGYSYGTIDYIDLQCRQAYDPSWQSMIPPDTYDLWLNVNSWPGQPSDIAVYASTVVNGGFPDFMQYIGSATVSVGYSYWIDVGAVPVGTQCVGVVSTDNYGSGIVWLNAVELIPTGQTPGAGN